MVKFFTFSNSIFFIISRSPQDLFSMTLVAVYQFGSSFAYSESGINVKMTQNY